MNGKRESVCNYLLYLGQLKARSPMSPSTEKRKRISEIRRDLALDGPSNDITYILAQYIDENERLRRQVAHLQSGLCKCA